MSESSSGVLFLTRHIETVLNYAASIDEPFYIRRLNSKWSGFFPQSRDLESADAPWLVTLSRRLPLLLLEVTDDHGWGYDVMKDGRVQAELWVDYELDWSMAQGLAVNRYPQYEGNPMDAIRTRKIPFDAIMQEVVESDAYRQAVIAQYTGANVQQLTAFDISPEAIRELSTVLTGKWALNQDIFVQVDVFKEQMALEGFEWMSYRYISQRDENEQPYRE